MGVSSTYIIGETETEATNDENLVDDIQHHIEKEDDAPQLQQSIVDVFDIYVQKMDQNYGQIIRENKSLRIFVYPSMVALNTFMVREAIKKSLTFFYVFPNTTLFTKYSVLLVISVVIKSC